MAFHLLYWRMLLILLVIFPTKTLARQNNNTIDDTDGDNFTAAKPVYQPDWMARDATPCAGCGVHPDASQMLSSTWCVQPNRITLPLLDFPAVPYRHENTVNLGMEAANASFSFIGVALYVFCVLPAAIKDVTTETHLLFFLDNQQVAAYNFVPTTADYQYNQLVFSATSLVNVQHTFKMSNYADIRNGPMGSIAMFDYALYTRSTDPDPTTSPVPVYGPASITTAHTPSSTTSSQSSTDSPSPSPSIPGQNPQSSQAPGAGKGQGVAIGEGAGIAVGVILLGLLLYLLIRRIRRRRRDTPYDAAAIARSLHSGSREDRSSIRKRNDRIFFPASSSATPPTASSAVTSESSQIYDELLFLRSEVDRLRIVADEAPPPTYNSRASRHSAD
ncbi:hypothetical protein EXIGLDRAFT_776276 [Exidia glandulosa HHB12029]|uniref:Uncharacterized protein n=1 Tax=Exidia glandulosa HHB12029 TaxID=1314781 RepID=A0A165DJK0_EXIGL|nr:hypothetical protein EXIGLDRAFT_776276 [Exidia glandulosa HHB12029]